MQLARCFLWQEFYRFVTLFRQVAGRPLRRPGWRNHVSEISDFETTTLFFVRRFWLLCLLRGLHGLEFKLKSLRSDEWLDFEWWGCAGETVLDLRSFLDMSWLQHIRFFPPELG
jgi:hypothetical protein